MDTTVKITTVDEYMKLFPENITSRLSELRKLVHDTVPCVKEKISWDMPTFYIDKKIYLQFAAYKDHIGIYPGSECIEKFADRLTDYKTLKGTIRISHKQVMPKELIVEMILTR